MRVLGIALLAWGMAGVATAEGEARKWMGEGVVEYELEHSLHTVVGRSEEPEFAMVVDREGLRVMARAPVRSFDSGNSNRDAQALAVVEAAHFPYVIVRGAAPGFKKPAAPATVRVPLDGEIELRGVKATRPIEVLLDFREDGTVAASFEFTQSLEAHRVARPSLLFMKVADEFLVRGEARLEEVR